MALKDRRLQGAAQLDAQLAGIRDAAAVNVMRASVGEALVPTLALARAAVPEGTVAHRTYRGRLVTPGFARRSTVISTSIARDKSSVSATIGVRAEAFYALQFVEFGTSKQAAQPWLVPAFNATRGIILSTLMDALRRRIEAARVKGLSKTESRLTE